MTTLHNNCRRVVSAINLEHQRNSNSPQHCASDTKRRYNSANATFRRELDEQLVLEDFEQTVNTPTPPQPPTRKHILSNSLDATRQLNSPDASYGSHDLLARGDFNAYQGANLNEFFSEETVAPPRRVSQICLVNDHFILVKMPETHWRRNLPLERIMEERSASREAEWQAAHKNKDEFLKRENRFLRYLPCQRSRRVSPVMPQSCEASEIDLQAPAARRSSRCSMSSCWRAGDETEVFETHTKLRGILSSQKSIVTKVITIQPNRTTTAKPLDLRVKRVRIEEPHPEPESAPAFASSPNTEQRQLDGDVFGSPLSTSAKFVKPLQHQALRTSLHDMVQLEQRTVWHSDEQIDVPQPDSNECQPEMDKKPKSSRRLNAFHWFFKRAKTPKKSKSKIHAIVHKTYFVRWKKPPDELCQHCGYARNQRLVEKVNSLCKWRRCRSATF